MLDVPLGCHCPDWHLKGGVESSLLERPSRQALWPCPLRRYGRYPGQKVGRQWHHKVAEGRERRVPPWTQESLILGVPKVWVWMVWNCRGLGRKLLISVSVTPLLASNREVGRCGFLGSLSFSHCSQVLPTTHHRVSVSTPAPHLGILVNADSELGRGWGLPGVLFLLGNSSGESQN